MKCNRFVVLGAVAVMLVLCAAANAVEVIRYDRIPNDIFANEIKAAKTWKGKEVCIRGTIDKVLSKGGNAVVQLKSSGSGYEYEYHCRFDGIPDAVAELESGQTVSITGVVQGWGFIMDITYYRSVEVYLSQSQLN